MAPVTSSPLPPVPGRSGWPWTAEGEPAAPAAQPDDPGRWPRITVVTPSLDQGRYIEETIRSVLLQGYPNLEYFVIDGGSADGTREILERYDPWLDGWVSEPDRGQAHAINKGWERSTGEILAWLNSDDIYRPGALFAVGEAARKRPGSVIAGAVANIDETTGEPLPTVSNEGLGWERFLRLWQRHPLWHQPGIFIPRGAWEAAGPLDESLRYCFDRELLVRVLRAAPVHRIDATLAVFRRHASAKTVRAATEALLDEKVRIVERHGHLLTTPADRRGLTRLWLHLCWRDLRRARLGRAADYMRRAVPLASFRAGTRRSR